MVLFTSRQDDSCHSLYQSLEGWLNRPCQQGLTHLSTLFMTESTKEIELSIYWHSCMFISALWTILNCWFACRQFDTYFKVKRTRMSNYSRGIHIKIIFNVWSLNKTPLSIRIPLAKWILFDFIWIDIHEINNCSIIQIPIIDF